MTVEGLRRGGLSIWVGCTPCGRGRALDIVALDRLPASLTIAEVWLAGRLRCQCRQPASHITVSDSYTRIPVETWSLGNDRAVDLLKRVWGRHDATAR